MPDGKIINLGEIAMLHHPMRRRKNEITDPAQLPEIIRKSPVMRLALCLDGAPYVIPLSHGYDGEHIYFHCAPEGLKTDILAQNPRVCCLFEAQAELRRKGDSPCDWGFDYATVIVHGLAARVEDPEAKLAALQIITENYAKDAPRVPEKKLGGVDVWKIEVLEMTGKKSPS
jgi:nitroimidazol reductase NimA-like FMN-containing flavoprotein (pyridoxamine 5'-phosphate oxidase superfamily)